MEESDKKNQGFIETFLDRKSLYDRIQQLKKEGYTVGEKEYEYDYTNHKKIATGWRRYRTGYWDNTTNKRVYYPEIKAIDKVSSAKYKPTTNGVVQQSFDKGNDAVFINNVEDANAKDNWAINEIIFRNANQAKLANPFTVDDNNNLISILKRDNFLNPACNILNWFAGWLIVRAKSPYATFDCSNIVKTRNCILDCCERFLILSVIP